MGKVVSFVIITIANGLDFATSKTALGINAIAKGLDLITDVVAIAINVTTRQKLINYSWQE